MSQPRMPGRNFLFVPGPTDVPDPGHAGYDGECDVRTIGLLSFLN